MEFIIKGEPEEIAALVVAVQEQRIGNYVRVRKPYQRCYSMVKVGEGHEGSLEDK